ARPGGTALRFAKPSLLAAEQVAERLVEHPVELRRDRAVGVGVVPKLVDDRLALFLDERIVRGLLGDQPLELPELEASGLDGDEIGRRARLRIREGRRR